MKKKLMILGSLQQFVRLADLAHERGYETVICDGYPDGPAKQRADYAFDYNVREIPTLECLCRQQQVDGIITSFSDLLFESMVKTAARTGLKCYLTPEQLPFYRDKACQKKLLARLGISTPKHVLLRQDFPDSELDCLTFPVVTKPLDSYGSRGIFVLNSPQEVRQKFHRSCSASSRKEILVEEYQSGFEFNVMSWVLDGRVCILGIADREKSPAVAKNIPVNSRNVYPSCMIRDVCEPAKKILETFIAATGQRSGALSMQFFLKPDGGLSVCEIAGRFLGYEHELIAYSSGLALEDLLLDYVFDENALADRLERHSPFMASHSAVLYFHARPGVIANMHEMQAIASGPDIADSQLFYREGETILGHNSQPYAARYLITGKTRAYIDHITERIFSEASIRDDQGRELLYPNRLPEYP